MVRHASLDGVATITQAAAALRGWQALRRPGLGEARLACAPEWPTGPGCGRFRLAALLKDGCERASWPTPAGGSP